MKILLNIIGFITKILLPLFLLGMLASIVMFFYFLNKIPNIRKINDEGYEFVSKAYTKDDVLIKEYAQTARYYVPLSELPPHVVNAFLAAEDARFFENIGIDIKGIFRAAFKNVYNKLTGNRNLEGASTITQQLIKNILLTNERTLKRKFQEIILSVIVTRELSKEKILELYLNYIFLGSNAYGIESAALEYFGKHAKELNVQEAATLAAMPKAPSAINPRVNYQKTLARRNWVIDQMQYHHFIENKVAEVAKKTPIGHIEHSNFHEDRAGYNAIADHIMLVETKNLKINDLFTNGYFIKTTIDSNLQKLLFNSVQKRIDEYQKKYGRPQNTIRFSENWCEELILFSQKHGKSSGNQYGVALKYKGIYNITVGMYDGEKCKEINTIALKHVPYKMGIVMLEKQSHDDIKNLRLPKSVEDIFSKNPLLVKPIPQPNSGAIIMHAKSGKILAMVGDYFDTPNGFNRATQAYRQLGSTIKPFVYQAAFENGFSPASKFIDEPITLGENWKPENSTDDYLGSITLRKSLELSRNVPTVRLADILGFDTLKNTFVRFGFIEKNAEFNLSSALGSIEITPLKAAQSYSLYLNQGKMVTPTFIEYIQDRNGKMIYQNPSVSCINCQDEDEIPQLQYNNKNKQLTSPQVAYQITSLLEGTVQRGTGSAARKFVGAYVGGKTGTTNDSKDSWFIGFNNKVIVAVYVGFDDATSLGSREYGATLALPIFIDVMSEVVKKYPSDPFPIPFGISQIAINYHTGDRVRSSEEPGTITEYFKTGDEIPEYANSNLKLYGY